MSDWLLNLSITEAVVLCILAGLLIDLLFGGDNQEDQ